MIQVRQAVPSDVPVLVALIRDLAAYEHLVDQVVSTEEDLHQALFGVRPSAEALLAEMEGQTAGFALFFQNFSTFVGKPGLYLEDLYVRPAMRRRGVGRALLRYLAKLALERGCGRFEWSALNWNEPAIAFYRGLGAVAMSEWTVFRLAGDALRRAAEG